ncbi:MAG: MFS transporter, partial [Candidatus Dormibacteria bacterium]
MKLRSVWGPYRAALAHRDLRLLLSGELISATGSWAYNVGLAVYVYQQTHQALVVSAVFLVRFVPSMLLSPYGGIIAERLERVRLLIGCDLLMAALQAGLLVTVLLHGPIPVLLALAALNAITQQPYMPAVAALIPQLA